MPHELRDKYKRYTIEELDKLFPNWKSDFNCSLSSLSSRKNTIYNFNEFDEYTKMVYLKIFKILKEYNPNCIFKLWATGSRVNGRWRNEQESLKWAVASKQEPRISDYDYITNAKIKPSKEEMCKLVGEQVDCIEFTTIKSIDHIIEISEK